ncbi:MAG: hypothetical protein LBN93_10445 [Candidatus Symbiothrix sp.]|nr:hypothetical protein [Candidatus Symbiothrix sp.]
MKKHYFNVIRVFIFGIVLLSNVNLFTTNAQKINKEVVITPNAIVKRGKPASVAPKEPEIYLNVSPNDVGFDYKRDNSLLTIKTNARTVSVSDMPSWCSYELAGDHDFLMLTCAENSGTTIRSGVFKINADNKIATVSVTQNAAGAFFNVSHSTIVFEYPALSQNIPVYVTSNYQNWEVTSDANWCRVFKTDNGFQVISSVNTGNARTATLFIKAGEVIKPVSVIQNAGSAPYARNTLLQKAMSTGESYPLQGGKYKGNTAQAQSKTIRSGLGFCLWNEGDIYVGEFAKNLRNGDGIFIKPDDYQIAGCPDAQFFVGQWSNDKKVQGSLYDYLGNLVYTGDFSGDRPSGIYPSGSAFSNYKFEFIKDNNNNVYVGETYNGSPNGYGFYLWTTGDMCYGSWENGQRTGGILIKLDGTITTD